MKDSVNSVADMIVEVLEIERTRAVVYSSLLFVVAGILVIGFCILMYFLAKKITHRIFRAVEKKQGKRIHIQFLERVVNFALILFLVVAILGWKNVGGNLLGSAAVLTGVIGFAAQDVIKDILSGLLISIYKPFDLGDRIELEDGTVGVVESITMRHVVIVRIDTLRMVVPNSRINSQSILNYSFGEIQRSCLFKFPVSYDCDVEKTKKVIMEAVKSSPFSIPGKKQKDGTMDYGSIYFIDLADSALVMAVTVYYNSDVASEKVKDDINSRVFEELGKNGIEVPYNHTTVVMKNAN